MNYKKACMNGVGKAIGIMINIVLFGIFMIILTWLFPDFLLQSIGNLSVLELIILVFITTTMAKI